jgi:hypothetical protein
MPAGVKHTLHLTCQPTGTTIPLQCHTASWREAYPAVSKIGMMALWAMKGHSSHAQERFVMSIVSVRVDATKVGVETAEEGVGPQ